MVVKKKGPPKIDYSFTKKEIKFSDFVRVISKKDAFLLTFAQRHPESDGVTCVAEIVLPPEIAAKVGTLIFKHIIQYEEQHQVKISPKGLKIEAVKAPKAIKVPKQIKH